MSWQEKLAGRGELTAKDFLSVAEYKGVRGEVRAHLMGIKKMRRVEVGPVGLFLFESRKTMWHQVQEMLYVEGGGEEQLGEELEVYNPLIPGGEELVATVMFMIDEPVRRAEFLSTLGGVEMVMLVGDEMVRGEVRGDVEREDEDGRVSSVHFMHFPLTLVQRQEFMTREVAVGFEHPAYGHRAILRAEVKKVLAEDFA